MSTTKTKDWWFIELWRENRELFKELVKHILLFVIFLVILELLHHLLKYSSISDGQKLILDIVDFHMVVIILAIFAVRFIIKAIWG